MTNKITKSILDKIANNCNLECPQRGWKFSIEYAYGKPRLVLEDDKLCSRDISPRLPKADLANWMWAFLDGVRFGKTAKP